VSIETQNSGNDAALVESFHHYWVNRAGALIAAWTIACNAAPMEAPSLAWKA
jgi:hypothetical protein